MTATLNEPDVDIEALWKVPTPPVDPPEMPAPRGLRIRPDRKEQWCKALRSGEWVQIKGAPGPIGLRYNKNRCAMGVLFELMGAKPSYHYREGQVETWFGVRPEIVTLLTHAVVEWNDHKGKSFEEIADLIERKF